MSKRKKVAQSKAKEAAETARPYVQKLLEDDELRGNLREAYESARDAYDRTVDGKGSAKAVLEDKKLAGQPEDGDRVAALGGGLAARAREEGEVGRRHRPAASSSRWSPRCSPWSSPRASARRCSTGCSAPRRSSSTPRPPLPATPPAEHDDELTPRFSADPGLRPPRAGVDSRASWRRQPESAS